MSTPRAALVSSVLSGFLLACTSFGTTGGGGGGGNGGGAGGAATAGQLPCDVADVLGSHCTTCHAASPKYGAPMPLVTYADLMAPGVSDPSKHVYELVENRIHDEIRPMPPAPNARLGASDTQTLDAWIGAGAPAATDSTCGAGGGGQSGSGGSGGAAPACKPDTPVIPSSSFTMPKDTDDIYICYGIDVETSQEKQVIGLLPKLDNESIVHHMVLFQADAAADPGPTPCSITGALGWRILTIWTPGSEGFVLPAEAGIPLDSTTHYVVQVHYNNLAHRAGQTDHSGFELCTTTDLRPNEADVLAFGSENFTIPAHGSLDMTCDFQIPESIPETHVIGATPHMHKLGTVISTHAGPAAADLGTRDPWDFNAQYWSSFDQVIHGGDTVSTRCAWANPTSNAVSFGEFTEDEMCFSFTMYYPRITAPGWSWSVPATQSKCSPTH
jgi:hypothetical protein